MGPFDEYPEGGRVLFGRPKSGDGTGRRGYGLDLQRRTRQTRCAYCGVSLVDDYHHWLLMSVDHVVPRAEAKKLGIPDEYTEDCANQVIACSGCNGFGNRFKVIVGLASPKPQHEWALDDFLALRDAVFSLRYEAIASRRAIEQTFFAGRPWLDGVSRS